MADMLVKLYDLDLYDNLHSSVLREHSITIRRAAAYEKLQITHWVFQVFGHCWASEVDVAFGHTPITCLIAVQHGELIGFACYDCTRKGYFGPTGVLKEKRGLGVGKALFLRCLRDMEAAGYGYAIIGGVGPQEFYARAAGAFLIPDSTPGVYRDRLKQPEQSLPTPMALQAECTHCTQATPAAKSDKV